MESDYIFYADESGDHSLTSIDQTYPIFALSLCGFKKSTYCSRIVPKFQRLKFDYFGHDAIILHEHDIRKQKGPFRILTNAQIRQNFLDNLATCISDSSFRIFAVVIAKEQFNEDLFPENPYSVSLRICLELAYQFLLLKSEDGKRACFIFKKRGQKEDTELELAFFRVVSGQNCFSKPFHNFKIIFSDKKNNSTGMQVADLTARPIGLSVLRPSQKNQAFSIISRKIYRKKVFSKPFQGIHIP